MSTGRLTWTSKRPDKAGWYWFRDAEENSAVVVQIHELGKDSPLFVESYGWLTDDVMNGEWAGPLPEPQEGVEK